MISLTQFLLAAFGLGLLIFIHEWGHYWMAKRQGMKVETFSIGFGKPLYTWKRGEVTWQLCVLPFGGFVRIAGMEKKGGLEPHQIAEGFYGKPPAARIKVALMGPCINIAFAFVTFCLLFAIGGRLKPFSDYTHFIGYVEQDAGIYALGVRPGDEIETINHKPFRNFQDFLYAAILEEHPPVIEGEKIDYFNGSKTPFTYRFDYPPQAGTRERMQIVMNAISPASYLIYSQDKGFKQDLDAPMRKSGIEEGDRILWVDGELIFSKEQLIATINEPRALLTVRRGDHTFLSKVPRVKVSDLQLLSDQRAEIDDWQHEAGLKKRVQDLFFIPYDLNPTGLVKNDLSYLNNESSEERPSLVSKSSAQRPLQPGDQIIAVDGVPASSSYEILQLLQTRHIQIIVNRGAPPQVVSWKEADAAFLAGLDWRDLFDLVSSVGVQDAVRSKGSLHVLSPVEPRPFRDLPLSSAKRQEVDAAVEAQKKRIEEMKNSPDKERALHFFEEQQNQLKLGLVTYDGRVSYNPSPIALFGQVFQETWKTLVALFTGTVTPKYMTGPVGIVHVMQHSWKAGFPEALFWLGMISLNLGILNLLPIPVLDGGHICFSLWEWCTGKPIKSKTMERLIIPFVVLLIALFIYLTYNDLIRLLSGLLK